MPQGSYEKHEELKRQIVLNPNLLGLEDIISHREEVPYTNGRKVIGRVDIIFWDKYDRPYIVEVTTSTTDRARRRLRKQVKRAKNHFNATAGITVMQAEDRLLLEWL